MTIYFNNCCRQEIILNIDDGEPILLHPYETKPIVRNDLDVIKVLVKRNCRSIKKSYEYHLIIETEYVFSGLSDGAEFTITREKIKFSIKAYYDRLFLTTINADCLSETHKILDEDEMKKAFNKSRVLDFIFDTVMCFSSLIIILLLGGMSLTLIWGWKIAVVYFPLAILFVFSLSWATDKFASKLFDKIFKTEDEKKEFYKYFDNDFIKNYYSDMNREPYSGKVETD